MIVGSGRSLRILQVNTFDTLGGAAKIARGLFEIYRARGHDAWLAVGEKHLDDPRVVEIPNRDSGGRLLRTIRKVVEFQLGIEDFRFPGTRRLLELAGGGVDIVHAHNLHGGYFDLRALSWLGAQVPVILTLHDAWLLSGHCGHSLDCDRWLTGCGHCPDLTLDPPIRRDATAYNWRRKQDVFSRSTVRVATPCRWLMDRVERSILASSVIEARVIPNGVDEGVFCPGDRSAARAALGLPSGATILLFVAYAVRRNPWKDYETLRAAIEIVSERLQDEHLLLLALGDDGLPERVGRAEVRYVPYQSDPSVVASYYQAADAYVHAARAETFPNSVLEALACGTPVVATSVGGIPEQIEDGRTGLLVAPGDVGSLATRLASLLTDPEGRERMSVAASDSVRSRFTVGRQADAYLAWYDEIAAGTAVAR